MTTATQSKQPNIDKVTLAFIKDVQDKGIIHAFEWIQGWMDKAAEAKINDDMDNLFGDLPENLAHEAKQLHLEEMVVRGTDDVGNISTSIGHNYMKLATLAEAQSILNHEFTQRTSLRKRWDELKLKVDAQNSMQDCKIK